MRPLPILFLLLLFSCHRESDTLSLADLKKGDMAEIISIEIPEEHIADSALHMRLFKNVGVKIGVKGKSRVPKEADRGINYGFDPKGGSYFGLYEPHASMVKVKILDE